MFVTFLGATHEVTGSCTMLEACGKKFLIDCGMEQGRDMFENQTIPVSPAEIDFVLLTHAHVDHSGNLPLLVKHGFSGPIYATKATCQLCSIMLMDCAHIQETEAEYQNRKNKRSNKTPVEPLYDSKDAENTLSLLQPYFYDTVFSPAEGIKVSFTDIGHLLGSAAITVDMTEGTETRRMVFSGDVGNTNQPIIRDPSPVRSADYLMIESTYGDRLHDQSPVGHVEALASMIQRAFDRGGNVIIPSFAVGRTQEMLYFIREIKGRGLVHGHDNFRVVVDSPLAAEATKIFQNCDTDYLDDEARDLVETGLNPLLFDGLELSITSDDSKALNSDMEPKVIISASGMCDAGRIRHHLKHNLWRPESLIAFVGYQAEGTLGRKLFDGEKTVKLFGEEISVRAEIALLPGTSGHADKAGLVHWLLQFTDRPGFVFVNHGEDEVCKNFADYLAQTYNFTTYAPYSGTVFDLVQGEFVRIAEPKPIKEAEAATSKASGETAKYSPSSAYQDLQKALDELTSVVEKSSQLSNKELRKMTDQIQSMLQKFSS